MNKRALAVSIIAGFAITIAGTGVASAGGDTRNFSPKPEPAGIRNFSPKPESGDSPRDVGAESETIGGNSD